MLAYGFLTLLNQDGNQSVYCKYEIDAKSGFQIYWLTVPEGTSIERYSQQAISAFLTEPAVAQIVTPSSPVEQSKYQASVTLSGLPASPADAFYNPEITYDSNSFSFQVKSSENFAFTPQGSAYFKDLNLTIKQDLNTGTVTVNGKVTAVIFNQEIILDAVLDESLQIAFKYNPQNSPTNPQLPINPWGNLEVTTLNVKPASTPLTAPQVLYLFGENGGQWVYDCSLIDTPECPAIDLNLKTDSDTVQWGNGSISLKEALIASENENRNSRDSSAAKIINSVQETNEITIAAWIKPSSREQNQDGPARIVTLSEDTRDRYFTLGQDYGDDGRENDDCYVVRLRTSNSRSRDNRRNRDNRNGTRHALESSLGVVNTDKLTYIVYTFTNEPNDERHGKLYLNGKLNTFREINLNNNRLYPWSNNPKVKLGLGNEISFVDANGNIRYRENRDWEGELYEVAIYNSALTPEAIYQRYYPAIIEISGNLKLDNQPEGLATPLTAQLTLEGFESDAKLRLEARASDTRSITPQFEFTNIVLEWEAQPGDSPTWELQTGEISSLIWKHQVAFTVVEAEDTPSKLLLISPEFDLPLDAGKINTLESIQICLEADGTGEGWLMDSTIEAGEVRLPQLRDGRWFHWQFDFKLLFPPHPTQEGKYFPLAINHNQVVLQGTWLGQNLALHGWWRNNQLVMAGERKLDIPFQVTLGPIFTPGTTQKIVDRVEITSVMNATLSLELTELGFLARVSSTFDWTDETGTLQSFTIPSFNLVRPPLTPNHVLEAILEQLVSQGDVIFAQQYRNSADYYFATVEEKPLIYLGASPSFTPQTQNTVLPQLFTTVDAANNISSTNSIFALTENSDGSCTLTITPTGITQSDLAGLKSDYDNFITQLDSNNNLLSGVITLVKTRIAERIPLLVEETLAYYYALDKTKGAIDLQAGMRLRVDYQNYQFVHPAQSTANEGFVGSGTSYYYLNNYESGINTSNVSINFDGFLSQLQPFVNTNIAKVGAASSLDTFQVGYQKPYLRLVYPSQAAGSIGSLEPGQVATLIASSSLTALDKGTDTDVASFYFRGRATVIPEITVMLQGQPVFVSVGTTLRQLMEQTVSLPATSTRQSLLHGTGKPRLSRVVHEGIFNEPSYRFINLPENLTIDDLPLVKGDRIVV